MPQYQITTEGQEYYQTQSAEILNPDMKQIKRNSIFCYFSLYRATQKRNQGAVQNRVLIGV